MYQACLTGEGTHVVSSILDVDTTSATYLSQNKLLTVNLNPGFRTKLTLKQKSGVNFIQSRLYMLFSKMTYKKKVGCQQH